MKYEHTQIGYPTIIASIAVIIIFGLSLQKIGFNIFIISFMIFILFILVSFCSLKVTIDEKYLYIKFGYGLFRKRFMLKEIISAKAVINKWYYGWGIRFLWPRVWIYNVSGFDAVEIKMKNRKTYRIGTDEPKNLKKAIHNSI